MPAPRKLNDDQEAEVWSLYLQRVPQREIARRYDVDRGTIGRTVARIQKELAGGHHADLERARQESLAVYRQVQREAWERLQKCPPTSHAAVGWMGQIVACQERHDRLLGMEELTVTHKGEALDVLADVLRQHVTYTFEHPEPLRLIDATSSPSGRAAKEHNRECS